jgi:phenylacetate-CoA ligase
VVTPLGRNPFLLLRFNTRDILRRGRAGCPCGRASTMISEVAGRADDLRKIRGVLLTPVSVEELLREEFPEIEEYEIIVDRKGAMDEITLRVEPEEERDAGDREERLLYPELHLRFEVWYIRCSRNHRE